jgi:hypothetical protein
MPDNVEILRGGYEAFGRGDLPAVLTLFDPDIEWIQHENPDVPLSGRYRGHQEVAGLFRQAASVLGPTWRIETDEFVPTDDGVLVLGRHAGVGPGAAELPFAMVWWMRDGLAYRHRQYSDTAALRAAVA